MNDLDQEKDPSQTGDAEMGTEASPDLQPEQQPPEIEPPEIELAEVEEVGDGASVVAEPEAELGAAEAGAAAAAGSQDPAQGRWVWQFGAPPPPPSFGSRFFGGNALGELYRFFACSLLVILGSLMPWGVVGDAAAPADTAAMVDLADAGGAMATSDDAADALPVRRYAPGYSLPVGALCLMLALWLLFASCYGIYTGRQKILPVFLMLVPTEVAWRWTAEAWGDLAHLGIVDRFMALFAVTGTGLMLTLIGSTVVAIQLLAVLAKVMRKTPEEKDKAARRAASKSRSKDKDKPVGRKGKAKAKDAADGGDGGEQAAADAAGKGRGKRRRR